MFYMVCRLHVENKPSLTLRSPLGFVVSHPVGVLRQYVSEPGRFADAVMLAGPVVLFLCVGDVWV